MHVNVRTACSAGRRFGHPPLRFPALASLAAASLNKLLHMRFTQSQGREILQSTVDLVAGMGNGLEVRGLM